MSRKLPYLARKIKKSKWTPANYTGSKGIRADAVAGGCIKTVNDTLSVWQCDNNENDIAEIMLAIISKNSHLEKMDIVLLPAKELEKLGFTFEATDGETLVDDLKKRHLDITNLDLSKISKLARRIAKNVRNNVNCPRFSEKQLKEILEKGIEEGRLKKTDLSESIQNKLS